MSKNLNQHEGCLICNSPKIKALKGYESAHLFQCSNCAFVFSRRIPSDKELEEHYEHYGRKDYLSPVTVLRYNELLDYFEKFRKTNRILDIGCGIGYFLEEAKKRNWEVYGTEYTDTAIKICIDKGIQIHKGKLDSKNYEPEFFDIITSFEVIEHINNPREELSEVKKIIRKNGLAYVTTPNFNAIERFLLGPKYDIICYPEHLSYYTAKTLDSLFVSSGFVKTNTTTTGISITRILSSLKLSNGNPVEENNSDDIVRNMTESSSMAKWIKTSVNWILNLTRLGNSLKGFYISK